MKNGNSNENASDLMDIVIYLALDLEIGSEVQK